MEAAKEEGTGGVGWGMDRLVVVGRKGGGGVGVGLEPDKAVKNYRGNEANGQVSVTAEGNGVKEKKRASRRQSWMKIWKRMSSSS